MNVPREYAIVAVEPPGISQAYARRVLEDGTGTLIATICTGKDTYPGFSDIEKQALKDAGAEFITEDEAMKRGQAASIIHYKAHPELFKDDGSFK